MNPDPRSDTANKTSAEPIGDEGSHRVQAEQELPLLFKFMSISEYTLKSLALNAAWYPKVATLNDPYDCRFSLEFDLTDKVILSLALRQGVVSESTDSGNFEAVRAGVKEYWDKVDAFLHKIGVYSLSERCDSITMWAHYASSHRGICIGFQETEGSVLQASKFRINYAGYRVFKASEYFMHGREEAYNCVCDIVQHKISDWDYEREWRVVVGQGNQYGPMPGPIALVIFGMNVDTIDIEVLIKLVSKNYPNCRFAVAEPQADSARLAITALDDQLIDKLRERSHTDRQIRDVPSDCFRPSWSKE